MLSRTERLKRLRITLMQGGQVDGNLVNPQIAESWQRCIESGLDPRVTPPPIQIGTRELKQLRERDELTHRFAVAEMHSLYQQIAGSNFLIAFGNAEGTVLDTIADGDFQSSRPGRGIVPGAVWKESLRGTNALGTCAAGRQPLIVHGEEHFFAAYSDVSCFAAPILHSDGELAGVLDASSDCSARHSHTLALMRMAATHIENSLFLAQQEKHIVVLFHSRWELLNSVSGGLVSFDANGRLVAVNKRAREILRGIPLRPGTEFNAIFDTPFDLALAEMSNSRQPTLRDGFGSRYAVHWRNRHSFERRLPQAGKTVSANTASGGLLPSTKPDFVANDAVVRQQLDKIARAVRFKPPFLICGESGTGKEMLARHIHRASGRQGSFIAVNCGALPEHLLEAELFGYVGGAFTGAQRTGAEGLAVAADRGTLFLDEIGDMPLSSQVALLRFLDSSEVRPVGGHQVRKVDTQIVAATNVDLEEAIATKRFREDLFYRLGVIRLELPALRDRTDFGTVLDSMLAEISPGTQIDPAAATLMAAFDWRGNMRELRSALLQLVMAADGNRIASSDVLDLLGHPGAGVGRQTHSLRTKIGREVTEMLRSNGNNISLTARTLGVSRNTVYKYARNP
ncbi:sigma-54-dependent Fis family transcriptional regulator [Rhizobium sp. KAs_5_22]|uniref:sigma-54-dependent Fis family transcriptional regulator n=1 Tax=Ciceribacter selenitireducens TaxID=448181 RepID=UPI00048B813B|nr:sigma-54-dependent Fis family transcriptional regulator [Ciceribacter selenitireducens]PPJ49002.1 sigma-54-dependent Fis family transcriptional regulator [Rhizobium sp. KAs_5_22]